MDIGGDMDANNLLEILDVFLDRNTVFEHKAQLTVPISPNSYLFVKLRHNPIAYAHGGDVRVSYM